MEDVCLVKIGWSDHKFEWLVGSVNINCEGVRKEENILKLEYIKGELGYSGFPQSWKILESHGKKSCHGN